MRKGILSLLVATAMGVSNLVCTKPSVITENGQNKPHLLKMISYGSTFYTFYYTPDNQLCSLSLYQEDTMYTTVLRRSGDTLWFDEWRFVNANLQIAMARFAKGIMQSEVIYNLDSNNRVNSIYESLPPGDTIQIAYDTKGNMKSFTPCDSFTTFLGTWEYDTLRNPFSSLPIEIRLLSILPFCGVNIGPNNPSKHTLCTEASHYPDSLEEDTYGYLYDINGYPTLCTLSVVRCPESDPNMCGIAKPTHVLGYSIYYY